MTPEVRCAVVGNVDSGKSTTLGVLTRGIYLELINLENTNVSLGALDDGRGRARVGLFRHKHELETGRTSSVGMEVCHTSVSTITIPKPMADSWLRAFWGADIAKHCKFDRPRCSAS